MSTSWTTVAKPSVTNWSIVSKPSGNTTTAGGTPIGLLLALTTSGGSTGMAWTTVAKPSGTPWTIIPKAT